MLLLAMLALAFSALSLLSAFTFYRKYEARLRHESLDSMRYDRVADYYGRPILLAFEYRPRENDVPITFEVDVDEIYHYGRDYFLKGRSVAPKGQPGQPAEIKPSLVFKWSRISNPRVRFDGRSPVSLEQLFRAAEEGGARAAA